MVRLSIPIPGSSRLIRECDPRLSRRLKLKIFFKRGEYGMGNQANELSLGCDCLGQIHYFVRSFPQLFYRALLILLYM